MAGKANVGLALHWPRVIVVLYLWVQGLEERDEYLPMLSSGA